MPTRSVPRLMMSSRRDVCWACADVAASRRVKARAVRALSISVVFFCRADWRSVIRRDRRLRSACVARRQTGRYYALGMRFLVVPANAGTHTPCRFYLVVEQISLVTSEVRGYGSLRSQGRRRAALVHHHA